MVTSGTLAELQFPGHSSCRSPVRPSVQVATAGEGPGWAHAELCSIEPNRSNSKESIKTLIGIVFRSLVECIELFLRRELTNGHEKQKKLAPTEK